MGTCQMNKNDLHGCQTLAIPTKLAKSMQKRCAKLHTPTITTGLLGNMRHL